MWCMFLVQCEELRTNHLTLLLVVTIVQPQAQGTNMSKASKRAREECRSRKQNADEGEANSGRAKAINQEGIRENRQAAWTWERKGNGSSRAGYRRQTPVGEEEETAGSRGAGQRSSRGPDRRMVRGRASSSYLWTHERARGKKLRA